MQICMGIRSKYSCCLSAVSTRCVPSTRAYILPRHYLVGTYEQPRNHALRCECMPCTRPPGISAADCMGTKARRLRAGYPVGRATARAAACSIAVPHPRGHVPWDTFHVRRVLPDHPPAPPHPTPPAARSGPPRWFCLHGWGALEKAQAGGPVGGYCGTQAPQGPLYLATKVGSC